jgi:hypothetical protein
MLLLLQHPSLLAAHCHLGPLLLLLLLLLPLWRR